MIHIRRNALLILATVVFFLTAAVLVISGYALVAQEKLIESVMESYVGDLADGLAAGGERAIAMRNMMGGNGSGMGGWRKMHGNSSFPPIRLRIPGGMSAVLLPNGEFITSREELSVFLQFPPDKLAMEGTSKVVLGPGAIYTLSVRQMSNGAFVLVAMSREALLGPLLRLWNFWIAAVIVISIVIFVSVVVLGKYFIAPLHRIVGVIRELKWGKDIPRFEDPHVFREVSDLQGAFSELAVTAAEREELKERYVGDMVRAQEDEKKRLARELHDGPLQYVSAMIRRLQISKTFPMDDKAAENLTEAEKAAQYTADEMRNLCDELSPSWLELGLPSALSELAERASREESNVSVSTGEDIESWSLEPENREKSLGLLRIFQEAVSNAQRHGGAKNVEVEVSRDGGGAIVMTIRDDGAGFTPGADFEELRIMGHRGLANMAERMMLAGGTLGIDSSPGGGCTIRAVLK